MQRQTEFAVQNNRTQLTDCEIMYGEMLLLVSDVKKPKILLCISQKFVQDSAVYVMLAYPIRSEASKHVDLWSENY